MKPRRPTTDPALHPLPTTAASPTCNPPPPALPTHTRHHESLPSSPGHPHSGARDPRRGLPTLTGGKMAESEGRRRAVRSGEWGGAALCRHLTHFPTTTSPGSQRQKALGGSERGQEGGQGRGKRRRVVPQ